MSWETVVHISKSIGLVLIFIAAITTIAKIWAGTAEKRLIQALQEELKLAHEHSDRSDIMRHKVRDETQAQVSHLEAELMFARDKLKMVEIENAGLLAKTDLSPVMSSLTAFIEEQRSFMSAQTQINSKMLEALEKITKKLSADVLRLAEEQKAT